MRALALTVTTLAALAALPALGRAQTRAISTNPRSAATTAPAPGPRGDVGAYRPHDGYGRRDANGGARRARPVVIIVSPYDGYAANGYLGSGYTGAGYLASGFGSATTTTYTGSYAPLGSRAEPAAVPDTTYVRYEPTPVPGAASATSASPAAASLTVERVAGSMLRLRWTGRTAGVHDVTLVVADASRRVIAAQSLRAAPFSAVFDNAARVAFVGTTVVRADGTSTTTLVPIGSVRGMRKPLPAIRRSGE